MSIYDDQFNENANDPPKPDKPNVPDQSAAPPPEAVYDASVAPESKGPEAEPGDPEPPRRRGCGCGSCLLAMVVLSVIGVVVCGLGLYVGYRNAPEWMHDAMVAQINDSGLDAETKQSVTADMDRLLKGYRDGKVSGDQIQAALKEFGESPILVLLMAYAAVESYVEPSGLSDEEKTEAKLVFQRVARGSFQKSLDPDDLEEAFDYISKKDFNGNRQMKSKVSDADLRKFIAECKRVADEAEVPNEAYQVDIAGEVTRIVDRALGINPPDEDAADGIDVAPAPAAADDAATDSEIADAPPAESVEN